jgi:glycosyltransferase involved in cell wall biosynthesis
MLCAGMNRNHLYRDNMVVMNARTLSGSMGGQQRVTDEIAKRLKRLESIAPATSLLGTKGHVWEQAILPFKLKGRWLWSPSGTGPIAVKKQIVTMHDAAPFDVPECFSPSFARFYQTLLPLLARRATKIVTVSEFSRRQLAFHLKIPQKTIDVIYNGVSSAFHPSPLEDIAKVAQNFELPERYMLVAATADSRKNFAGLVKAWQDVSEFLSPDLHLIAMGNLKRTHVFGDHDLSALQARRFRHIGFVSDEDLAPLITGAEAFLFPSLYEGFGLPILEAMACGTPVLTSNCGAMQEIAGQAACLIDPHDPQSLREGLLHMARDENLKIRLRAEGLVHAQKYTWEKAADAYQALFAQLEEGNG